MNAAIKLGNKILNLAGRLAWLPPLIARVTVGWVFVESGWGKLHNIPKVTAFFESLSLPLPAFQAHMVSGIEFAGGLLLIAGLATRLASIPLGVIMIVAIKTARVDELHGFSDLIGFIEYLYLVLLIWLAIAGPGKLSLDALVARKCRKRH